MAGPEEHQGILYAGLPPREGHWTDVTYDEMKNWVDRGEIVKLPLFIDHNTFTDPVGKVTRSWVDPRTRNAWIGFQLNQENPLGLAAERRLKTAVKPLCLSLSHHAMNPKRPVEISLCEKGMRAGTMIVRASESDSGTFSFLYERPAIGPPITKMDLQTMAQNMLLGGQQQQQQQQLPPPPPQPQQPMPVPVPAQAPAQPQHPQHQQQGDDILSRLTARDLETLEAYIEAKQARQGKRKDVPGEVGRDEKGRFVSGSGSASSSSAESDQSGKRTRTDEPPAPAPASTPAQPPAPVPAPVPAPTPAPAPAPADGSAPLAFDAGDAERLLSDETIPLASRQQMQKILKDAQQRLVAEHAKSVASEQKVVSQYGERLAQIDPAIRAKAEEAVRGLPPALQAQNMKAITDIALASASKASSSSSSSSSHSMQSVPAAGTGALYQQLTQDVRGMGVTLPQQGLVQASSERGGVESGPWEPGAYKQFLKDIIAPSSAVGPTSKKIRESLPWEQK